MRILLGIPTSGNPTMPFLESLQHLDLPVGIAAFDRYIVQGNFVPAQRELIVERALGLNADVLVMCDDDIVLPPNALADLCFVLETNDRCGLAGALYYSRDGFRPMAVDDWDPHDTTSAVIPAFDGAPVSVSGVGFGCVAIRVAAIRELAPLYFPAHVFVERRSGRVRVCNEDYLFCNRLRKANWDVLLVPSVRCGHFDRATGRTSPTVWETEAATNSRRMVVAENSVPRLIAASAELARASEQHLRADIDYLLVD